jgi:N-sulfoglucosamine sulfohydrolase
VLTRCCSAFLLLLFTATSFAVAPRPNIVLFVTDDMSPDAGCFGNAVIKTPALDALAKDGIRVPNAFCTTASCSASRSVILTGIHNHANAHYGHAHAYHHFSSYPKIQSLPVRLTAAGYRTVRIGKFHVEPEAVYKFETVLPGAERNPVQMAENCREVIAAKDDQPFFLYFCTADPHRSGGEVPGDPLKPNPFGNSPTGYKGVNEVKYDPADVIVPPFLPDTPTCRA